MISKWEFRVRNKKDHLILKAGEWVTDLSSAEICNNLDLWGWEIVYLQLVDENFCAGKTIFPIEKFSYYLRAEAQPKVSLR